MALLSGSRLGAYEILALLGAGGMGEVYRARDTRLKREVAIKVLPGAFASDPERLARFQREAELLATLNHPNIGAVYGVEQTATANAIVLELIEGDTLADRIGRGALPVEDAVAIAKQIAEALETAHDRGVIHRDLKPANIKVTASGDVKVLDFGLAKMHEVDAAPSSLSMSPTLSLHPTNAGVILGTAAYMSPEQARGKPVDRRTDIWAFGCVLFEMLTGKQTFDAGDTVSDAVAAILKSEPDWKALPRQTPVYIRALLHRCLQKDPRKRLPHIGVARLELGEEPAAHDRADEAASSGARTPTWRRVVAAVAAALVLGTMAAVLAWRLKPVPAAPIARLTLHVPEGQIVGNRGVLTISNDGTKVAYLANGKLYVRDLNQFDATTIVADATTRGYADPTFSPDGRSLAFWTGGDNTIKKVSLEGGPAITICRAAIPSGMSWSAGSLLFGQGTQGIMRVSDSSGTPELIIRAAPGEMHHGPQMLPDGEHVLFTLLTPGNTPRIIVQSVTSDRRDVVIPAGTDAKYAPTGHLTYVVGGTLFAVPFDAAQRKVTGQAVPVIEGVARSVSGSTAVAHFGFSQTGSLVYIAGPASTSTGRTIALMDRQGNAEPLALTTGAYEYPRVSPDGTHLTFGTDDGKDAIVWVYDLAGTSSARHLTFAGRNRVPIWSGDGKWIAFQSDREGDLGIWWQRADGSAPAQRLTTADKETAHIPESWLPKTATLLFSATKSGVATLHTLSIPDKRPAPVEGIRSVNNNIAATFSPDGRWIAYTSNESGLAGDNNVFVQPFPTTGAKYQISKTGENGHIPLWSPDGTELFYVPGLGQLVVVAVRPSPTFSISDPVSVPRRFPNASPIYPRAFDITPSGKLVAVVPTGLTPRGAATSDVRVVLNWFEELKQRVPSR